MSDDPPDFGRPLDEAAPVFSPAEEDLFANLVDRLKSRYGTRLQAVKLVGSRARGTAMERSDYDILVFLDACDYGEEVPKLEVVAYELSLQHGLGALSLSPMTTEQFCGLDAKYPGITEEFRRDALNLWP
jgi:predicted nucleotidyltransferase